MKDTHAKQITAKHVNQRRVFACTSLGAIRRGAIAAKQYRARSFAYIVIVVVVVVRGVAGPYVCRAADSCRTSFAYKARRINLPDVRRKSINTFNL